MATPPIPVKTADGQAELSNRQRRLSQRHRTILLLVDGRRSEVEVRQLARQAGASDSCFGELLDLGLIQLPQPTVPTTGSETPGAPGHVDIPIEPVTGDAMESLLPQARTLPPESVLDDAGDNAAAADALLDQSGSADADTALEEAREVLVRALRTEAPITGSLTLLRVRRARTRADLAELIDEVQARIVKPNRSLAAQQTLRRARHLLGPVDAMGGLA